jgi:hypothetical protein
MKTHFPTKMFGTVLCFWFVVWSECGSFVTAWGKEGHEVVGNLAWKLLSEQSQSAVRNILQDVPIPDNCTACSPLGQVADWADTVRRTHEYFWSGPLHYVDIMDEQIQGGCPVRNETQKISQDECRFEYERDCANDICVAGAVVNYTQHLHKFRRDETREYGDELLVRDSLMFLTHFVGDLHQPLHVSRSSDRGGNSIHVVYSPGNADTAPNDGRLSYLRAGRHHHVDNLHAVWDTGIIETCVKLNYKESRVLWEKVLYERIIQAQGTGEWDVWTSCPNGAQQTCVSEWSEQSLEYALIWAYRNVDGTAIGDGTHLSHAYYETRLPFVEHQLTVAAARLATTLEISFTQNVA